MAISGETYGEGTCANPDCKKRFTKSAPHQDHCCDQCRNHHTYLRTVLPKRKKLAGKKS